jgi:hypothetical protein
VWKFANPYFATVVSQVEGTASSLNCGREYSLHTEVFNLEVGGPYARVSICVLSPLTILSCCINVPTEQLGLLKSKADLYALVATFLSLAQVRCQQQAPFRTVAVQHSAPQSDA